MKRISRFLTQYRWLTYLLIGLLCVPPVLGVLDIRFPGVEKGERPRWVDDDEIRKLRDSQEAFQFYGFSCIIVLECDDFFTARRMNAIRQATKEMQERHVVYDTVIWLGMIPQITLFNTYSILPESAADADFKAAEQSIREHSLVKGQLLSDDGTTMLLFTNLWGSKQVAALKDYCREKFAAVGIRSRVTGAAPLMIARIDGFEDEHSRILYTAMGLIVILALIIFRGISAIIIACSGPALGVFWTIGWLSFIGDPGNDLTDMVLPVMVLIIGFTDSVHFVVHVRQERVARENNDKDGLANLDAKQARQAQRNLRRETATAAINHVGMACLLTSITTAIGFGSLMIADTQLVHDFGRASAIGVLVTFVAIVLVVPLLSASWLGRRIHAGYERDLVGTNIRKLSGVMNFIVARRRLIAILSVILTIGLLLKALTLTPDDRLAHRVPNASEAYQAMLHVDKTLGGTRFAQVEISWTHDASREEIWQVITEVEKIIEVEPLFSSPLSVRSFLSMLPGGESSKKLILANLIPEQYRSLFWQPKLKKTQIVSRLQDLGVARYEPVIDRMNAKFDAIKKQHPGFETAVMAELFVYSGFVKTVVKELFQSLFLASIVIFFVITFAYRSLRLGLLSIIPNLFPLVATGAIRAIIDPSLDVSSACSFAICLGIAVDDTIHFLSRYQYERKLGYGVDEAIKRSFVTVGSALVMTTVVMIAGFLTVMTSSLPTHALFGAMASTTIATALLGDLIILPALLACFPGKSPINETNVIDPE
jgi:predicted RND superfamily exporter protein